MSGLASQRASCLRNFTATAQPVMPEARTSHVARLACFPHSGGAATAFAALAAVFPPDIELLAVQYPGRQERRGEPAARDIAAIADEVAAALLPLADRPLALFGHSMGALAAFETARLLERHGDGGVVPPGQHRVLRLFASAGRPPSQQWDVAPLDATDGAIVAGLRRLGGVPELLLTDDDIRCELLRIVRDDNAMMHRYSRTEAVLAAPVTVLLGTEDPKNNAAQAAGWARHTTAGLTVREFPGGHFYLNDQLRLVASLLAGQIRRDLAIG